MAAPGSGAGSGTGEEQETDLVVVAAHFVLWPQQKWEGLCLAIFLLVCKIGLTRLKGICGKLAAGCLGRLFGVVLKSQETPTYVNNTSICE